jgi:putative transcriptional regulator
VAIRCVLKVLIARENLRRAESGQKAITMSQLASDTGIAPSVISTLANNRTQRVDFKTLDRLCDYFGVGVGELLVRESGTDRSEALQGDIELEPRTEEEHYLE